MDRNKPLQRLQSLEIYPMRTKLILSSIYYFPDAKMCKLREIVRVIECRKILVQQTLQS